MEVLIDNIKYPVLIDKKKSTKNTYIRVKDDLTIYVTTNYFTRDKDIVKLLNDNYDSIVKMIRKQEIKNSNNENFNYLGKNYDIIYTEYCDISFGENNISICFMIDQIISIAERSGELGGHLGKDSSSQVGIYLSLNRALIIFLDNFEEWHCAPSCWKIFEEKESRSSR